MAEFDFEVHHTPGSDEDRLGYPVTASQTFLAGEPVVVTAAGRLSEATDDPASVRGIAAHRSTDRNGDSFPEGQTVTVILTGDTVFRTQNFATDGAGTLVTPIVSNIGDPAGFTLSGDDWSLDTGTANVIAEVVAILDIFGNYIDDPNALAGDGLKVLFRFI